MPIEPRKMYSKQLCIQMFNNIRVSCLIKKMKDYL